MALGFFIATFASAFECLHQCDGDVDVDRVGPVRIKVGGIHAKRA